MDLHTKREKNPLLILFSFVSATFLLLAILLHVEIVTPDAADPKDIKPNLEEDLRPTKEAIVQVLFLISGVFAGFCLLIYILEKRKSKADKLRSDK